MKTPSIKGRLIHIGKQYNMKVRQFKRFMKKEVKDTSVKSRKLTLEED